VTEYLSTEQIAAELDVHPQTVLRYFRDGTLPGRKVGKGWRTSREALDAWLTGAPAAAGPLDLEQPTVPLERKVP
jgi:excisionase family DNA binding protein